MHKISFDISENWFRVNIKRENKVGSKVGSKVTENQTKILKIISENPHITKKEILNHITIGKTAIDNNISKLKKMKLIKRIDSNKTRYWKIKK